MRSTGVHHVDLVVTSLERFESEPREHDSMPGYYAVFFCDPDGLKLEIVHLPERSS